MNLRKKSLKANLIQNDKAKVQFDDNDSGIIILIELMLYCGLLDLSKSLAFK